MHKLLKKNLRKSQVWYMDFILGLTIFLLIMIISFKYMANSYLVPGKDGNIVLSENERFSEALMGQGIPQDWDSDDVVILGIASEDNVLDLDKLDLFKNMTNLDYDDVRGLMAITSEFLVFFEDNDGNILNLTTQPFIGKPSYTYANVNDPEFSDIFTITRYMVYRHDDIAEIVSMKVVFWKV